MGFQTMGLKMICSEWGLAEPLVQQIDVSIPLDPVSETPRSYDQLPDRAHHARRLSMVVDCKPLADVLCGSAVLTDGAFLQMFVRMARFVAKMCGAGRRPKLI